MQILFDVHACHRHCLATARQHIRVSCARKVVSGAVCPSHVWKVVVVNSALKERSVIQVQMYICKSLKDKDSPFWKFQCLNNFFPTYAHQFTDHHLQGIFFQPIKTLCKPSKLSFNLAKPFLLDFKLSNTEFQPFKVLLFQFWRYIHPIDKELWLPL